VKEIIVHTTLVPTNGHRLAAPAVRAGATAEPGTPIKLTALIGILWRRLWLIVLCTLVAGFAGWVYVRNVTPLYKSTARIFVDRAGPVIVQRSVDQDLLMQANNFRRTQAEIIKSVSVVSKLQDNAALKEAGAFAGQDNPVSFILKDLETKVGEDDLIYISFQATKPELAAQITNAVVDAYYDFVAEQRHSTTAEVLRILEKEKEKHDADFSSKLKKLTEFRMANGDIAVGDKSTTNPVLVQLAQYSDALSRARLELIDARAQLEAATSLKDNTDSLQQFLQGRRDQSGAEVESAKIRRLRDQIEETSKVLQETQLHFTADHPQVGIYQSRLTELNQSLTQAEADYRTAILLAMRQQVELSQARVDKLQLLVEDQHKLAENINTGMAQLELLQTEFAQSRNMVEILNARIKDLNIGEEAGVLNVKRLENASPTQKPAWPDAAKILRLAIAFGMLLGLVGALALETVDDRVRSAEAASQITGLSVLGVVPSTYKPDLNALATLVHEEPQSQFAEAFRTLRTGIFFGTSEGHRKIILTTSPLPGDGKSTVTANLAQILAQVGKKTVLLDCDFRRPRLHTLFGLANDNGLSSIISGQAELATALHRDVQANLDVLPSGPIPPNPAELLNSEALHELLSQLAADYDHIVIDSPPVLAVTDARIIAACADVTLMVLRADQTRKKAAQQAKEQLDSVGANTLGLVINCTPRSTERYGYGSGYATCGYYQTGTRKKKRETPAMN
jgi:polysaccharide biosynthesis transport protein